MFRCGRSNCIACSVKSSGPFFFWKIGNPHRHAVDEPHNRFKSHFLFWGHFFTFGQLYKLADGIGLPQLASVTLPLPSQDVHLTG
jgi:hypothetical protein